MTVVSSNHIPLICIFEEILWTGISYRTTKEQLQIFDFCYLIALSYFQIGTSIRLGISCHFWVSLHARFFYSLPNDVNHHSNTTKIIFPLFVFAKFLSARRPRRSNRALHNNLLRELHDQVRPLPFKKLSKVITTLSRSWIILYLYKCVPVSEMCSLFWCST